MTRELDSRTSDGIHVRLLWHPTEDRLSVEINDTNTSEIFEPPVRDRGRALEVFRHPFAYAVGLAA